ncbi:unnamed protein product [Echinostoma caproni]|uniref:Phosphorylated adapter RNA export protein n=1 Tax=Echinostoma caproni TaxID=27848 RepID=A0A183B4V2_9TREM|nr:unnamed protein product [Echinostoma caproni]
MTLHTILAIIIEMPKEYTEAERAVKKGLSSLRKMKRTLTDLSHIRKEEKPRGSTPFYIILYVRLAVKPGEKAKEEAMQLLRSGAISLENKKERQTFKRKAKHKTPHQKDKQALYGNFLRGPKLYPQYSSDREHRSGHSEDTKPFDSPDLSSTTALLETAASKRKQQLIALSEEELEDTDVPHTTGPVEPGALSSPVVF